MPQNVAGLLCYLLGFVTGLIFYLVEKENRFVRFHAMQSIVVFGGLFVINIAWGIVVSLFGLMPVIGLVFVALGGVVSGLIGLAALVSGSS